MAQIYDEYDGPEDWTPSPIVAKCYERRKLAAKHAADWKAEARESFEFRDGEQWDSEDRARLEEQGRPIVVFNRVAPIIDSIVGWEINNRQELQFRPRTMEDTPATELYTEAAKWVMQGCEADDEETDAYGDAVTCGMGWTEWRVDYDEEPEGKLVKERVPPLEMRWDPRSRKANCIDADWVMREKRWLISDIEDRWPHKAKDLTPTPAYIESDSWLDEHDASRAWQYRQDQTWQESGKKENKALVIHYQWRERELFYRVGDPASGRVIEFTPSKWAAVREYVEGKGLPYVRQNRWVYKQAFVTGPTLLETGPAPIDDGFSYHAITGKRDEQHGTWYGLMRQMRDPQKWANAFFSTAMHTLMSNAKGGLLVEESAVQDMRQLEEQWARPEGIVMVEDGAITAGRIQERSMGGYPSGLDKLMAFAISSIRDCTGINLELLGMAERDQPNVLEMERKRAALTILSPLVNSLHRYRVYSGRALLSFMRRYIPEGTIMRVTGKPVPFYRDDDTIRYDVVIDTAPSSPNLKQEVWGTLSQLVPSLVKAGVPVPPALLRFSPLPESVAEEWIQYISSQGQVPEEIQKQIQEGQQRIQQLESENQLMKAKREEHFATLQQKREESALDAQIEREKAAVDRMKIEMEAATREKVTDRDRIVKLAEIQARYETEIAGIRASIEAEREKSQAQAAIAHEKNVVDMQTEREKLKVQKEVAESDHTAPHLDRLKKVEETVTEQAEEAEKRRAIVLDYLEKKGGEVSRVVEKLREVDRA